MGRLGSLSGLRAGGEEFPIEASISYAEMGEQKLFTAILRDVSERRRLEAHQSFLLRELGHRIKNSLGVVQAIAALTKRNTPPDEFHDVFSGRLVALSRTQDMLLNSSAEGAFLHDVAVLSLAPFEDLGGKPRCRIEGPTFG